MTELAKADANKKMIKQMMSKDAKAANAAFKAWENLPEDHRRRVLENVYCEKCLGVTEIVDFKTTFERI